MFDFDTLRRRAAESARTHRPALIAFGLAALSFILAGILIFTPGVAEGAADGSWARRLARVFAIWFGPASILLIVITGLHATLHLIGKGMTFRVPRIAAATALVIFVPCLFAIMGDGEGAAGGVIGVLARDAALFLLPKLFAVPVLIGATILALILSTDWLFYGYFSAPAATASVATRRPRTPTLARPRTRTVYEPGPSITGLALDDEEAEAEEDAAEEVEEYGQADGVPYEEDEVEEVEEAVEEDEEAEYEEEDAEEEEAVEYEDDDEAEYEEEEAAEEEEEEDLEEGEYAEDEVEEEEEEEEVAEEAVVARPSIVSRPKPAPAVAAPAPKSRSKKKAFTLPGLELLSRGRPIDLVRVERQIQKNAEVLERTLASFKVEARVVGYERGPVITMFELALKEGTKLSTIVNLSDDMAIALKAESVRIVAPIPGKSTVGVEVPNGIRDDVFLASIAEESATEIKRQAIPLFLGRDAAGRPLVEDLAGMPHLLIAGATGSGKSVCINSIIVSILLTRRPDKVKLILIDPKQVELAFFREIPHLLTAVVTDARKAAQALDWAVNEMEERYWLFARFGVRNIAAYNRLGAKKVKELANENGIDEEKAPTFMPYLVVVVDELADLMMTGRKEVEQSVTRLAQKSRAVGIHTVLATQRPSTDVITGLIKANMPSRASFKVTSKIDSRVVLDQNGAEKLLGRGDMLFLPPRAFHLKRCQGTFVDDEEVKKIVAYLKSNAPGQELRELFVRAESMDERDPNEVDDLFDRACRLVLKSKRGSASLLQRALSIGYTRASRLIDLMRANGIIGEFKNAQAAEVLMTLEDYETTFGDGDGS